MDPKRLSYVEPQALGAFVARLFAAEGLPDADARLVGDALVEANLRGVDSHGVIRVPVYLKRLRLKLVNPRPQFRVERVATAVALIDGDNGMGFVVGARGIDHAVALAREAGIGLVGAIRSNHFGMAATYVRRAVEAGMLCFVFTNSSKAMPVWGGRAAFLGTSPFAAGAPGGARGPYVVDMATSVVARGKVRAAAMRGEAIPPGLALDEHGRPTTDGRAADRGIVLPFGGAKGAALSMLMDILGGVLTGALFAGDVGNAYADFDRPQGTGHVFLAIRPDLFMSAEAFRARMDVLVERVKAQPAAEGFDEILMPGEPESRRQAERARTGIPLPPDVVQALAEEGQRCGATPPAMADTPLAPTR